MRRRTELVGLTHDDDGITAVATGPDGEHRRSAAWLMPCDGGHSTVRRLTGAEFPGLVHRARPPPFTGRAHDTVNSAAIPSSACGGPVPSCCEVEPRSRKQATP